MRIGATSAVAGLVVFGTFTSLAAKIVYQLQGRGLDGALKNFEKPWTMTTVMFVGMTFCLPLAVLSERRQRGKQKAVNERTEEDGANEPLLEQQRGIPESYGTEGEHSNSWKSILMLSIPTLFDLIATVLMNVGLLSVTASVYQMLRGAEMLFAALFAVVFLKRKLNRYHFAGIACCIAGIGLVGASSMASASGEGGGSAPALEEPVAIASADQTVASKVLSALNSSDGSSSAQVLLGMALIVASQAVQAAQITFEDYFMADLDIPPLKIVGYEGLFGSIAMIFVMLPIVQHLPGPEGGGIHEDSKDTWHMITHTPSIATVIGLDAIALLAYNVSGMCVTGHLGAVFRTVLETTRTLFVWLVDLLLFYTPLGFGRLGEEWTWHSWIQAAGFVILVGGTVVYGKGDEVEVAEVIAEAGPMEEEEEAGLVPRADVIEHPEGARPLAAVSRTPSIPLAMPSNVAAASSLKSSMNINAFGSLPMSSSLRTGSLRYRLMSPPGGE